LATFFYKITKLVEFTLEQKNNISHLTKTFSIFVQKWKNLWKRIAAYLIDAFPSFYFSILFLFHYYFDNFDRFKILLHVFEFYFRNSN